MIGKPLLLALGLLATPALATTQAQVNDALRADSRVWSTLSAAAAASEISERCPQLEAREFRARADALALYNYARGLGYTRQQIRSFIDDRAEKDRLRADVIAWFARQGLTTSSPAEGFCALGRSEIENGTLAGRYLRAR